MAQGFRRQTVRGHFYLAAEVSAQGVDAANVVWMQVRQDNFTNFAAFREQFVNALSQRELLVFVRRGGVENDDFRAADKVAIGVRGGRFGGRPHGETDKAGMKFDAARRFAMRLRQRQQTRAYIVSQTVAQSPERVQDRRHDNDLGAFPTGHRAGGGNPFARFQFAAVFGVGLLFARTIDEKKPGVKAARRERITVI